jgi:TatD DNase family protein
MQLIDIGVNLAHDSFDRDRPQVIERALAAGVTRMILTGSSVDGSRRSQLLTEQYSGELFSTAGVHPHDARHCDADTIPTLRELATHRNVVAIGECGLDYNRDFSPRPLQDKWFEEQVKLACELRRPLFLHERDAHPRFVEILSQYHNQLGPAVVHCFTGTQQELDVYLQMDFYIGLTGWICDERRGLHLRELVKRIPLSRLMLETDAPFLIPRTLKPKPKHQRNEPAYLVEVVKTVAESLGKSIDEVTEATTKTAEVFFRL